MKDLSFRLYIYECSLIHYKGNSCFGYISDDINNGFCYYIFKTYGLDFQCETFPELFEQKPKQIKGDNYWFPSEDINSRIFCLEKAIVLTKEKIKNATFDFEI